MGFSLQTRRWHASPTLWFVAIPLVLLIAIGMRPPAAPELYDGEGPVEIVLIDHGWHTGLVIEQAALRRAAIEIGRYDPVAANRLRWLSTRFPEAEWLELGWGDSAVYQTTRQLGDLSVTDGLRALLVPTPSVLQIVPGFGDPKSAFGRSDHIALRLSLSGTTAMATRLAQSVPDDPAFLGPSLYGPGVFVNATPSYHLLRTCNHWVSDLIRAAGVPSSLLMATFSGGLMAELKFRGTL